MAPASKTVCVMDASGQFGSSLVRRLLQKGYTVHAAVQNHVGSRCFHGDDDNKRLRIFNSDPLDYHSIMDALKGCSGLFYSFEPPSNYPTYDEYMAELEVRAAHNVLEACGQTETIDKVVFTSSATAVVWSTRRDQAPGLAVDEKSWSDVNFCRKFKLWHALSKTMAEKTAWALAMDREVSMVSVNGGLLMGPDLTIQNPYLKGAAEMYEDGVFVTVEMESLVDAHVRVFEDVSSYGRYLCFDSVIGNDEDAFQLSQMLLPPSHSSSHHGFQEKRMYEQRISNSKLGKLMVDSIC